MNRGVNFSNRQVEHINNFEAIYQTFVDFAFDGNKKLENDLGWRQQNYDGLYSGEVPELITSDGRSITIRWTRIPTFTYQNKPMFYTAFFVTTDWFMIKNIPSIHALCMQIMTNKGLKSDTDSYTIFLQGKQKKWSPPSDERIKRRYNTLTYNTNKRGQAEIRGSIFKVISSFFNERCENLREDIAAKYYEIKGKWHKVHLYGQLKKDLQRLKEFMHQLWKLAKKFYKIRMLKKVLQRKRTTISNNSSINKVDSKRKRLKANFFLNKIRKSKVIKPV